jgi:transcription elongation factor Elf1
MNRRDYYYSGVYLAANVEYVISICNISIETKATQTREPVKIPSIVLHLCFQRRLKKEKRPNELRYIPQIYRSDILEIHTDR